VRLTPRARAERIEGVAAGRLKVSVAAPASENQANDAQLRLLAKQLRLPGRDLSIVAGAKSRNKIVHIAGNSGVLLERLAPLLHPGETGGPQLNSSREEGSK
jgi:uncharacterized protein YggU (UPF0235/DUF167 family)